MLYSGRIFLFVGCSKDARKGNEVEVMLPIVDTPPIPHVAHRASTGKCIGVANSRWTLFQVESVHQCQKWCDQHPSCNYFTWRNSSIFQNFCFMMAECGDLDFECVDCFSGPKTTGCPLRRRNF